MALDWPQEGRFYECIQIFKLPGGTDGQIHQSTRLSGTDYHSRLGYWNTSTASWSNRALTGHILPVRSLIAISKALQTLAPRTQGNRMCVIRQFCEYLTGSDPQNYEYRAKRGQSLNCELDP